VVSGINMISTLHRILPFIGRVSKSGHTKNQTQGQQRNDSDLSGAWLTVSHHEPEDQDGTSCDEAKRTANRKATSRSKRLLSGVVMNLPFKTKHEFVIVDDISNGREMFKIPALSYKRYDNAPTDYHYVTEHVQCNPVPLNRSLSIMGSCGCEGNCGNGKCQCSSTHRSGMAYDTDGRLSASYNMEAPEIIYECNEFCNCNPKICINKVIQGGSKQRLALFRTRMRGWGVRAMQDMKRGTFIGVYSGELISGPESCTRQDDTYLFNLASTLVVANAQAIEHQAPSANAQEGTGASLDGEQKGPDEAEAQAGGQAETEQPQGSNQRQQRGQKDEDQFVCDAKFYGNFTRFVNHSCDPNVIGIRSYTTHQDSRFPYISFFTNRDLSAGTELTLNYGDNYWLVKCKRDKVFCLCRRPNCRFSRKTFNQTLRLHNEQRQNK